MSLKMNNQLVRIVHGIELELLVNTTFPNHQPWKFCGQTSPVFVPGVTTEENRFAEQAIEVWLSGKNGKRWHVSSPAMVRHLCTKGLIPAGNYLVLANPQSYGEQIGGSLSDESTIDGPKGIV